MKLAFFPGELHLTSSDDGSYLVTVRGQEILRTRSKHRAVQKFNEVRLGMEKMFPSTELTAEEKAEILRKSIANYVVNSSSVPRKKKKSSARSTRTFG